MLRPDLAGFLIGEGDILFILRPILVWHDLDVDALVLLVELASIHTRQIKLSSTVRSIIFGRMFETVRGNLPC